MDGECGVVDRRQAGREAWSTGMVTILVPPPIFQEVQAVFDSPVLANMPQEISSGHLLGIEAAHIIACIMQDDFTVCRAQLTIHTQTNLATGQI
jgi:hypothetical protein